MKHKTPNTAFAAPNTVNNRTKKNKKRRLSRAEKKAERARLVPIHKRPVVCPPDRVGRHPLFRLGGILCRALVIWLAAAGLVIFVSSALEFGVSNLIILLCSLCVVTLGMLFSRGPLCRLLAGVLSVGGVAVLALTRLRFFTDLLYGLLSLYNAALDRLYKVGYLSYVQYKAEINTPTASSELMVMGVCLLTVLVSALFVACLARRVRVIPPAVLATTLLVVLLTFNIYSNRIESNLGITLVIIAFASVLVMAAYDRLYHQKDTKTYDTELSLFEDSDRPTLPADYAAEMADRKTRKERKAELRKKRRKHTVTVDEELSDYFGGKKKKAKQKKPADKKEAKAQKAALREKKRQIRAVKHYDRVTADARTAMSGYASSAVLLLCAIAIALPSLTIKGNFNTIAAIDEKVALARNYVTALLRGDDDQLDRLEYQADGKNFEPHSTALEQLEFTGKQLFYLQSRYNTNYYLRGWIGTDYEDGAWLAVDEETLSEYQSLFGKEQSPSEDMKYGFYHYMKPALVDDPSYTENYLTKYKSNLDYGFVSLLVSLRRVNSQDTLTYFPASYDRRFGLFEYNTMSQSPLTYVNFYDGLYTGRRFDKNGLAYSTVALAPVMTNRAWIENQANLQAAYNLQREALFARTGFYTTADGAVVSNITLLVTEQKNGTTMFMYTLKRSGQETIWRFYHDTASVSRDENRNYIVTTDGGILTLSMDGSKIVGATVTGITTENAPVGAVDVNLVDSYDRGMTDEERATLMTYLNTDKNYADFVYSTYLDKSDSAYLSELAETIKNQAHVEKEEIVTEEIPDDPETPEDDSFTYEDTVIVNVPADVSLAAVRNSSDPEVYIQRDRLVRNIIDYIITEMECTYTITPDLTNVDATLDGVENFLANTKEGYCVQFASATALLLRELGIPARYVEGYVASGLKKIDRNDFVYGGYVHDYEAHAWVEVYFDGVGWIQYETTPQYYAGMYGTSGTAGSRPTTPVLPETDTSPEDEPIEPETDESGETLEPESSEESTNEEDATAAEITRNSLIGLAVLVVLGTIIAIIATIVSRARAAEDHRQSIAAQILEPSFGQNTSESDRREMALEMTDAVTNLLAYFDLAPNPGEFGDEYATRLTLELSAPVEGKKQPHTAELPDLKVVFDGIAAEEFGHGMSISEMKAVATLYGCLRRDIRRRIAAPDRFRLRYIKRKI